MQPFLETWGDPHARHAMLVHIPLVLGLLGVIPLAALAAKRFDSPTLRWVSVVLYVMLALGSWIAAGAGEEAIEEVRASGTLSSREASALAVHEGRGERAWIWPLIPATLCAALGVRNRTLRAALGTGALVAAVAVSGWFCVIGHAGGRLVYVHGLGVPGRTPGITEASAPVDRPADHATSDR